MKCCSKKVLMDELTELIEFIQKQYDVINDEWLRDSKYITLNMKTNKICDIYGNEIFLIYIFNYRHFIKNHIAKVVKELQRYPFKNIVSTRVKTINSIQYKIYNYMLNHENGKVALKKCLNDVFGIRMIFNEDIDYDIIKVYIDRFFPRLKCIDVRRGVYVAVHIYFGNDDNTKFQWELQLWDKKHEKTNLESHYKYKQDYTNWEENLFKEV